MSIAIATSRHFMAIETTKGRSGMPEEMQCSRSPVCIVGEHKCGHLHDHPGELGCVVSTLRLFGYSYSETALVLQL
jgi:hypothetical protein